MMRATAELLGPSVWLGDSHELRHANGHELGVSTGHDVLDAVLPFHGWPVGMLTEVFHRVHGLGELQVVLPALARLTQAQRYVAMIDPPLVPNAPALVNHGLDLGFFFTVGPLSREERLWALEQVMRSGHCGATLAWLDDEPGMRVLRRLQLAAEVGKVCCFLFRGSHRRGSSSPAALRLEVLPQGEELWIDVFKSRGHVPGKLMLGQRASTCSWPQRIFPQEFALARTHEGYR